MSHTYKDYAEAVKCGAVQNRTYREWLTYQTALDAELDKMRDTHNKKPRHRFRPTKAKSRLNDHDL